MLCAKHYFFLSRTCCRLSSLHPKCDSNVPLSNLPKWPLQCFVPHVLWTGEKQHEAHGTMLGAWERPVWGLAGWGATRGDRTVCNAPTGCKQSVWTRPRRDGDGAAKLMCPGDFSRKIGWMSSESPKAEPNTGSTMTLHWQNCSCSVLACHALMVVCTWLWRDLGISSIQHNMVFPWILGFFQGISSSWGCP